jgi:hypothetical protein
MPPGQHAESVTSSRAAGDVTASIIDFAHHGVLLPARGRPTTTKTVAGSGTNAAKRQAVFSGRTPTGLPREETVPRMTRKEKGRLIRELMDRSEIDEREQPLPWDMVGPNGKRKLADYMPRDAGKNVEVRRPRNRLDDRNQLVNLARIRAAMKAAALAAKAAQRRGFFHLPPEIRNMIYGYLVVQPYGATIMVHLGWTKVIERQLHRLQMSPRPNFPINALIRIGNKQLANEALDVLYGENVFEYFFRDAAEVIDAAPVGAGGNVSESASDADRSFGQPGSRPGSRKPSRKGKKKKKTKGERLIPIGEVGHKMRNLSLRIESNRAGPEYRIIMGQALGVFTRLRRPANIHTVTIHVSPTWGDGDAISFADYFVEDSAVTAALRRLPCQHVRVAITTPRRRVVEVTVDRRYARGIRRADKGKAGFALGSELSQARREMNAAEEWKKMNSIAQKIRDACMEEARPAVSMSPALEDLRMEDRGDGVDILRLMEVVEGRRIFNHGDTATVIKAS